MRRVISISGGVLIGGIVVTIARACDFQNTAVLSLVAFLVSGLATFMISEALS